MLCNIITKSDSAYLLYWHIRPRFTWTYMAITFFARIKFEIGAMLGSATQLVVPHSGWDASISGTGVLDGIPWLDIKLTRSASCRRGSKSTHLRLIDLVVQPLDRCSNHGIENNKGFPLKIKGKTVMYKFYKWLGRKTILIYFRISIPDFQKFSQRRTTNFGISILCKAWIIIDKVIQNSFGS